MRKLLLLLLVAITFAPNINAQRKVVYVEPFTSSNDRLSNDIINAVGDCISQRVDKMGRVNLTLGKSKFNKSDNNNTDYIISGNITSSTTEVQPGKSNSLDSYVTKIKGSVSLLDAKSLTVIEQKSFDTSGSYTIKLPSIPRSDKNYRAEVRRLEDEAYDKSIERAISNCGIFIPDMIDNNIKVLGKVTAVAEVKKDEIRAVIINKGTEDGVSDGQRFVVNVVTNQGGYPVTTKLGEIRVKEQPTAHSAMCKVTSGKKEIKAAMDSKAELSIVSRTAKLFD